MKLHLNKNGFVSNMLNPLSKLTENLVLEFDASTNLVKTLATSSDNSLILIANTECKAENPTKCIIPDCKTFLRLFSGIEQDNVALNITSNAIEYKNNSFSFKYHLLDEGYVTEKKSISEEKLKQLQYETTFVLTKAKISEILKFNSIIPEAEKVYFYTESQKVFAKIGDEQKSNTNEIVTELSDAFEGDPLSEPIPLNIQSVLLMSFAAELISVSINKTLKILKFSSPGLEYIASGLVK